MKCACGARLLLELSRFRVSPRYDCRMVPGIVPGPVLLYAARGPAVDARVPVAALAGRVQQRLLPGQHRGFCRRSSAVFSELNDPEATDVIERLRRSVELAAEYGIDFYWDLKTGYEKKFPDAVYERLPHLRTFTKFGNFPCTGQKETLDFLDETIRKVFTQVENLKGSGAGLRYRGVLLLPAPIITPATAPTVRTTASKIYPTACSQP